MAAFHEALFPLDIALGARGGPERRTDIVTLGSGREVRNARWASSRRKWEAGFGVKSFADLALVLDFFEERRGRLYGFRWRDRLDCASARFGQSITPTDQAIGMGDGLKTQFQLIKTYGGAYAPYARIITKPVANSVRVAINNIELQTHEFLADANTGRVTLSSPPAAGASVAAGFRFDTPVRFGVDFLDIDYARFDAGEIPEIPIHEILE